MIKKFFARNIYNPLHVYIYRRDNRLALYRHFKQREQMSTEENIRLQKRQLYELLKYTLENIPYYKGKKIHLSEETVFEDIRKFPILTKDIIRKHLDELHHIRKDMKWIYNSSGGSTGEPVKFIQDDMMVAGHEATTQQQYDWMGYHYGEPMIRIWGSERDIFKQQESLPHRFSGWVRSETLLNSFKMDENDMYRFVDTINSVKPKLIVSYAQSMYQLAKFIDEKKLAVVPPGAIMTSASVLYPEYRRLIEKIFRRKVFNRYGSREVGNIAAECEEHEGMHMNVFTHYVEILDKKLRPCKDGETGDVYVTLLTNYTMPLIRYQIGDMAIGTSKRCSCGRGLPMLKEVIGRDNDMFVTREGAFIHTGIINSQFYFKDHIKRYQVVQKKPDHIIINIVPARPFTAEQKEELEQIKQKLKRLFGSYCKIEYRRVKDIKPTASGKYRFTIREF